MQQDWDDLDKMIIQSKEDIKLDSDYNDRLMLRLRRRNAGTEQSYIGAFSLIMAGFLALFIYTSDIQYKIANMEARARMEVIELKYNYDGYGIIKYLIGE